MAHSWYDSDCCSEGDCHPVAGREVADGFVLEYKDQSFHVAYGDKRLRVSADTKFHLCINAYLTTLHCVYVPGRGI